MEVFWSKLLFRVLSKMYGPVERYSELVDVSSNFTIVCSFAKNVVSTDETAVS